MSEMTIPAGGANPYASHPGFDAPACPLRYTVTQRGPFGGIKGGFGCEMTGGHCLPSDQCDARRASAAEQDAFAKLIRAASGRAQRTNNEED